jgi:hypothetical protein
VLARLLRCTELTLDVAERDQGLRLGACLVAVHGEALLRAAFIGGISHMEAGQKLAPRGPFRIETFCASDVARLAAFDPDVLSMYPSYAREIVASRSLELRNLRTIKLGGEPVLASDLDKILRRLPHVAGVEQLGSTEMPAIAWRVSTASSDSDYRLSADRYECDLTDTHAWQPWIVRDTFPGRALPIDDWFETDDEVRMRSGLLVGARRAGDPLCALREDIDALARQGCIQVQVLSRERVVVVHPESGAVSSYVVIGGVPYRSRGAWPERFVHSNKLQLVFDTEAIPPSRRNVCKGLAGSRRNGEQPM